MKYWKITALALSLAALTGCDKGAVAASDVTSSTTSGVSRDAAVQGTKELTTTKEQSTTRTKPLLPMLLSQAVSVGGNYANAPWEQITDICDAGGADNYRICAGALTGSIYGKTWAGWPVSSRDNKKELEVMINWFAVSEPMVRWLGGAADAVAGRQGLTEAEYKQIIEDELKDGAEAFVAGMIGMFQVSSQNSYTIDSTGFKGMRFTISNPALGHYDFQGTAQGAAIYKNGAPYFGGDNYLKGEQYYVQVVQSNAAAATRSSTTSTTTTNQTGGGVEGRAGTQ